MLGQKRARTHSLDGRRTVAAKREPKKDKIAKWEDTALEQYNREELYRKVWEQPLLKVAEEYGVSSVALGKTCRKLSVPVPGRGHWAKLAHGHAGVKKPPLLKLDKVPVIYRSPVVQKKTTSSGQDDPEFAAIDHLLSSGALNPPSIDPTARPHPLIRRTASRLRSNSRKDENAILLPREPGGLDVKVKRGNCWIERCKLWRRSCLYWSDRGSA